MILSEEKRRVFMSRYMISANGCWEWTGTKQTHGYGLFPINRKYKMAHRISYEIHKGNIPDDLFVMHVCDNRSCINPEHLNVGTAKDNSRDMAKKGRWNNQWTDATHCKNGHEFTFENTKLQRGATGPARRCAECSREANRQYKLRQKQKVAA